MKVGEKNMNDYEISSKLLKEAREAIKKSKTGKDKIGEKIYDTVALRLDIIRGILGTRISIVSTPIVVEPDYAYFKAEIYLNLSDRQVLISNGYATRRKEDVKPHMAKSLVELATTKACGRALAFFGLLGSSEIASVEELDNGTIETNDISVVDEKHQSTNETDTKGVKDAFDI